MEYYTSASWVVKEGKEDEFVAGWRDWIEWSRDNVLGLISARLVRDTRQPRHFISLAQWEDPRVRDAWWMLPAFAERVGALRALCESFDGGNYDLAAALEDRRQASAA